MTAILQVQSRLPSSGLDELLERPWIPLINACFRPPTGAPPVYPFPLWGIAQAPNVKEFLDSLGKPLAIARELESRPGIWWLTSPDASVECLIFSDVHRKHAWKGGQWCVRAENDQSWTIAPAALMHVSQAFEAVWGQPDPPLAAVDPFGWSAWFKRQATEAAPIQWPAATPKRPPPRPR